MGADNDRHMYGFSVRIVTARDQALVRPAGELDLAAVGELEAAIGGALDGHKQLVVDLRDVTFLDTEGLKSLIEAARVAAERHVTFRLVRGRRWDRNTGESPVGLDIKRSTLARAHRPGRPAQDRRPRNRQR